MPSANACCGSPEIMLEPATNAVSFLNVDMSISKPFSLKRAYSSITSDEEIMERPEDDRYVPAIQGRFSKPEKKTGPTQPYEAWK